VFALLLAERGVEVVGVDPAGASLDVARGKPGADRVRAGRSHHHGAHGAHGAHGVFLLKS